MIRDIGIKYQIVDELIISKVNRRPVSKDKKVMANFVCHNNLHLSNLSAKTPPNRDIEIIAIPGTELIKPIVFSDPVRSKTIQAIAIILI